MGCKKDFTRRREKSERAKSENQSFAPKAQSNADFDAARRREVLISRIRSILAFA
jgi:hypothetical protein